MISINTPSFKNFGMSYCSKELAGRASQAITIQRVEKLSEILPAKVIDIAASHTNTDRLKRLEAVAKATPTGSSQSPLTARLTAIFADY